MAPAQVSDDDQDMEVAAGMAEAIGAESRALTTTSQGGMKTMLKETPITLQKHHFGLPETVTKVLTQTSYITPVTGATPVSGPIQFQFRLNTPYDWFISSLTTPTTSAAYTTAVFTNPALPGTSKSWPSTLAVYPTILSSSTGERPQWREFFEKQYGYYTVLGLEYELTFFNVSTQPGDDVVVAWFTDSYSDTNATFIHPTGRPMRDMEQWPDVSFKRVPAAGDGDTSKAYRVIKGYYRPGSKKTSVENDEDMKTWTKTTAGTLPSLTEIMTVSVAKSWDNAWTGHCPLNCRIDMRWIVQYKDLKNNFRWPASSGQTPISLAAPGDILFSS